MMRNPVHSRFGSSNQSPHRHELLGAENSGSENTSTTVEKALMLKSPPMKSTLCWCMYPCSRRERSVEASRFLAHDIVDVYRAKCDRRVFQKMTGVAADLHDDWDHTPRTLAAPQRLSSPQSPWHSDHHLLEQGATQTLALDQSPSFCESDATHTRSLSLRFPCPSSSESSCIPTRCFSRGVCCGS